MILRRTGHEEGRWVNGLFAVAFEQPGGGTALKERTTAA